MSLKTPKPSDKNLLSVIVPVYNCPTIKKDLKLIDHYLKELGRPYEIICVVDGSSHPHDTTKVKARSTKSKNIKVYTYSPNKGKGYALRFGMARARGGLIAFIDAGNDLNVRGLGMALEHFKWYDADIIIGSKRHKASKVDYPFKRKILSIIVQRITKLFFNINVTDTQTGLKLFRRDVLEKVLPRLAVKRWAFDLEVLVVANRLGYKKIYESPIELSYNFASNIKAGSIINFALDFFAIVYRAYILHYYNDGNNDIWEHDPKLKLRFKS
jgi:glycosyltransferase involved in cell wall biosynthesis